VPNSTSCGSTVSLPLPSSLAMEIHEDGDLAAIQLASSANDVDADDSAGSDIVMATAPPAPALADENLLDLEMPWPGRAVAFRARPRQSVALSGDALNAAQEAWDLLDKTPERQAFRRLRQQRQQQVHERQRQRVDDSARRVRQRQANPAQVAGDRGSCAVSNRPLIELVMSNYDRIQHVSLRKACAYRARAM